jgi:hypothetical protein
MRTIEVKLFLFSELSEEAKQTAISNCLEYVDNTYNYDEAHQTVKAFEAIFPTDSRGNRGWLECNVRIDDDIENLEGERLRKYIYNNFGSSLYTPKYIRHLKNNKEVVKHRRIKSTKHKNGNVSNCYYSAIQVDNSCVLTGVCWDINMLKPLYKFLDRKGYEGYNFSELLKVCYENLETSLRSEDDYLTSEEGITEMIECNEYEFTEDGERA